VLLVERLAEGHHDALAELYDRHGRAAFSLAYRLTADRALAEDAVQEAFCAVWRGAVNYRRARGTVSSWLLSLVHHKAVDIVRRENARRRPLHPDDLPSGEEPSPEELALAADEGDRARAALGRLKPDQRRLLSLLYLDGLTQREAADRLGVPIGTVKSRTHAAMRSLRRSLAL
jgi:RNA polymerase sigma-70 factor (ECF subfamily)